jgi:hypothetical protein
MKIWFLIGYLSIFLFSCNKESKSFRSAEDLEFIFSDSIQIDFLGNLFVFDFDREKEVYLGRSSNEIILFDDSGEIKTQFTFKQDGPNKIYSVLGIGFLEGKVTVMATQNGLSQFAENGGIFYRISIPNNYTYFNGLSFPAFKIGEEYAYIRPERDGIDWDDLAELMTKTYQNPLLEIYDPKNGTIRNTMPFPPNTIYSSGDFYSWMFPKIIKTENEWLVSFMAERKYHVYHQVGKEVQYVKSVDLEVKNSIPMSGIAMEKHDQWDEKYSNIVFGRIEHIFKRENDVILIYTKGVSEDISKNYNRDNQEEYWAFRNGIPRYAAVFDHSHQLIQNDIELPKGIIISSVLTKEGKILAKRNQDAFGVEENIETFYKLQLTKLRSN